MAVFFVAVAGLIYELIAATLSSYLLGDSVRQFSLVIGVFLSAMGVGAWLSRFVSQPLPGFVIAQILLGLTGGFLAAVLYFTYAFLGAVAVPLYGFLILIGILSGMEIPLIARVLKQIGAPEFRFENVLSVDYIGALIASVAFPLVIVPHLNLISASLLFGSLNLAVAGLSIWMFRDQIARLLMGIWLVAMSVTLLGLVQSERLLNIAEVALFEDDIILSETTPYQNITITRFQNRTRLFLNHSIQFDTLDEHRYHEALVHPVMGLAPRRDRVLILGGGDGMAAREVLKYGDVSAITLVDLDPRVTALFRDHPELAPLNNHALSDGRLEIVAQDAWQFVTQNSQVFDVIIIDLPDPKNISISKLYSKEFYGYINERLTAQGLVVTQSGSPVFARQAFWSIAETLEKSRNPAAPGSPIQTLPYHAYVPSFGQWGFVIASPTGAQRPAPEMAADLRYMSPETWHAAQIFPTDAGPVSAEVNSIQSHALVGYYNDGWDYWFK